MEETSNINQNNQYSLSIRFSSDGFSLLVNDISGYLISKKNISSPIFSLTKNELVTSIAHEADGLLNYQNIRLICESDNYTFVPIELLEAGNESDFFLLEHQIDQKDCIISNKILMSGCVNVFSLPINLRDALSQLFENTIVEHHLSYFLTDKIKLRNETLVQVWVRAKIMDVVVQINGNLHLINSYTYNTPEDFTYYTLNIFDQLSLDTETIKVKLFNVESGNEIQNMIQRYVRQVEVC